MNVAYLRVSTDRGEQSDDRQRLELSKYNIERTFSDSESGFTKRFDERENGRKLIDFIESNPGRIKCLYVVDTTRFSRRVSDALRHIIWFMEMDVQIIFTESNKKLFKRINGRYDFDIDNMLPVFFSFWTGQKESEMKSNATKHGIEAVRQGMVSPKKGSKIIDDMHRQKEARKLFEDKPWVTIKYVKQETGCSYYTVKRIRDEVFRRK